MLGDPAGTERLSTLELVCTEHLQRTLLTCDEATAFQGIVSQAVWNRRGQWEFAQYDPPWRKEENNGFVLLGSSRGEYRDTPARVWREDDTEETKGMYEAMRRRVEFLRNEGRLIRRMEVAAKGIRQAGLSTLNATRDEPSSLN